MPLAALTLVASANAATVTVTGTDDSVQGDGVVSLREAITSINAGSNVNGDVVAVGAYGTNDTINFNIPGSGARRILVGGGASIGALPALVKPVSINGYTQGGASANTLANGDNANTLVLLDGSSAGLSAAGLLLEAGSSTIRGLAVFGFGGGNIAILRSNGNTIVGNEIGFDPGGAPALSPRGVLIQNAGSNTIGGSTPADRNVISGNFVDGVEILGSAALPATANVVRGNFIGTGTSGVSALGNGAAAPAGAGGGVQLIDASSNTIGGAAAGARNVIAGNGVAGILDRESQANTFQGNFIGIGADGVTAVPNPVGVWLMSSNAGPPARNNDIGGTEAGSGNLIFSSSGPGVVLTGATTTGNQIFANSINANGGLGIDLGNDGVTPNSPGGPHTGPNNLQNFPVVTAVSHAPSSTTVQGTLNATPSTTFRVEFFQSAACDPSGFGEG
ncbi:MAG: trimeric autotransporter adhesin, partial [Thermoleophilaceae bacterium]|nr:trimeric autotransporter adhesin [Thermoleophilaceae bacterium]